MNVKFLNPFLDAASEVLQAEVQTEVTRGELSLQKSALTADEITVLISLIGEIQGVVLYGLSTKTGLAMVSRVIGQSFSEMNELAQSGVAELANVITGRASVKFSESGFESTISPPTIVLGKGINISTLDFSRIVVPLKTEMGDITVHLALREAPTDTKDSSFVPLNDEILKQA